MKRLDKYEQLKKIIEESKKIRISLDKQLNKTLNQLILICPNCEDISSNAGNANNIFEAVICYINHGEYNIDNIIKEIEEADKREILF